MCILTMLATMLAMLANTRKVADMASMWRTWRGRRSGDGRYGATPGHAVLVLGLVTFRGGGGGLFRPFIWFAAQQDDLAGRLPLRMPLAFLLSRANRSTRAVLMWSGVSTDRFCLVNGMVSGHAKGRR